MDKKVMPIIVAAVLIIAVIAGGALIWASQSTSTLEITNSGLEPLSSGHYEGWAIYGDEKITTGKFNISSEGEIVNLDGESIDSFEFDRPEDIDKIAITIEAEGDDDDEPSGIIILEGEVSDDSADLSFVALDLSESTGKYFLATPSTTTTNDETAGVWFLDPSSGEMMPGLDFPEAQDGWVYEGWVVYNGDTPLTTGRFSVVDADDDFSGYSGPEGTPPFPGEDFVTNLPDGLPTPLDFTASENSTMIVISIEPDIDGEDPTGDSPFTLKPFTAMVPSDASGGDLNDLEFSTDSYPSASVTIK